MSSFLRRNIRKTCAILGIAIAGGGVYVGGRYYQTGSLPELPEWVKQYADRPLTISKTNIDVDQLKRRQLSEHHQIMEKQRDVEAVEEQRKLDRSLPTKGLKPEKSRMRDSSTETASKMNMSKLEQFKDVPAQDDLFKPPKTERKNMEALQHHTNMLKKAVDSGVRKEEGGDTCWAEVKTAKDEVERCTKLDEEQERAARASIKELEQIIVDGKLRGLDTPLLLNARETSTKLSSRLDELNLLLGRHQAQMRIFTNYRDLVEQGRKQWADELKSVFPDIDLRAKQGKLTHEELDAFIVHANIRIDQLKRQLAERQAMEEQRLVDAVEEQRKLDESLSKMALELEMRRIRNNTETEFDSMILEERKMWEREMDMQLRRAAIAHAEHLERVIKTQKQLHDVENQQLNEEAVKIERNKFAKQIGGAVTKLSAIEESLNNRAAMDLENRKAKIYWTICQSLMDALVNGDSTKAAGKGSKTLYKTSLKEVALIKKLTKNDSFAQHICNHFPPAAIDQGVPTEQGLKQRFDRVYKLARWTAQIGEEGGGLLKYIASWLQSLVTFELPTPPLFAEDRINVERYEPYELLSQIRHFVEQRDLANAVRLANLMRGEPARVLRDWLNDAKYHLEVRFLIELLFAHSQAAGIMTTY
ncbi:hypothetical protein GPALN_014648 [Globodera pallida]|nr:hypothetical protein GPALN_014648 [Globodera pallida]